MTHRVELGQDQLDSFSSGKRAAGQDVLSVEVGQLYQLRERQLFGTIGPG